jgi:hypothetical protein
MQVLQAGPHKLILLELDLDLVMNIARQAGFEVKSEDTPRSLVLDLAAQGRQAPLLLFDAADQANLGWFSRCQFYVEGRTGAIMQTPITIANQRDRSGRAIPDAVRLRIAKELPSSFHLPGKQAITEQVVYALLYNVLSALTKTGVAVCGGPVVQPLAGRTEGIGPRN